MKLLFNGLRWLLRRMYRVLITVIVLGFALVLLSNFLLYALLNRS